MHPAQSVSKVIAGPSRGSSPAMIRRGHADTLGYKSSFLRSPVPPSLSDALILSHVVDLYIDLAASHLGAALCRCVE